MPERDKVRVDANVSLGSLWFTGWLFTIGFVGLSFLKGALALILWPYFLGAHLAGPPEPSPRAVETDAR